MYSYPNPRDLVLRSTAMTIGQFDVNPIVSNPQTGKGEKAEAGKHHGRAWKSAYGYAASMITRPQDLIAAASDVMAKAGIVLTWTLPHTEGEPHMFAAINKTTRECWKVTGTDPMQALTEPMEQCGFKDLL